LIWCSPNNRTISVNWNHTRGSDGAGTAENASKRLLDGVIFRVAIGTFGFLYTPAFQLTRLVIPSVIPQDGELDDSLFWGICQGLNIPSSVNNEDRAYQKAYRNFLSRLIEARNQAGLTQVEVAKRFGKARTFVSKCELGERRVDFVELQRFAKLYGKDLAFFVD
jgi:DNA-binding XRE family transcriptional regulator